MNRPRICLLGGSGFVGRHLAQALNRGGHELRVLTRRRERHRDLLVLPRLELVETNIHYVSDLMTHFKGCDAVVNLVGILNQGGGEENRFEAVHAGLPAKVVEACRFNGVGRLLHMSALNAAPGAPSEYLRSKARGEAAALQGEDRNLHVTSLRPSVIFGPDDDFFNRFALFLRLSPVLPLAGHRTRFAPVYVGDVAAAFVAALDDKKTWGRGYDLCGPQVYTLRELVQYTARQMGLRRWVPGLGPRLSELQARVMEWVPGRPLTRDNLLSMRLDSVCEDNGLPELGITPTALDAIVPGYLGAGGRARLYERLRGRARRERRL